jgi:two-component system, OmpR family, response regulator
MNCPRVLIAEDEAELRGVLVRGLGEEGFEARGVATGGELLDAASVARQDALIIDIGLPDADGRDVCQALRARGVQTPVVFLTARDALADRLSGFRVGGDDYLTKPFALDELIARLNALLRRVGFEPSVQVGALHLDPTGHALSCGGESTALTPTEFRIMATLAARPTQVVRRRELIAAAWPDGAIVHENTLDVYMARVRRKLRSLPGAPRIVTTQRVGYYLQ